MEQPPGGAVQPTRRSPARTLLRRAVVAIVVVSSFAATPALVDAVSTLQFGRTDVAVEASPLTIWRFDGAPSSGWEGDAFEIGGTTGLQVDADGLTVAPIGTGLVDGVVAPTAASPTWWDEAWGLRLCDTVTNADPAADDLEGWIQPIDVDLDALVADGLLRQDLADLRAVVDGTEAALWVDATDPAMDRVWVPVGAMAAGSTHSVCLYAASPSTDAPGLRGAEAVFGPGARVSDLVALDPGLDGTADTRVAALWGPTAVAVTPTGADPDGVALSLAEAETATIGGLELGSIVRADGPLSSRSDAGTSLVAVSESALELVADSADGDRVAIAAPFGETTVTISRGSLTLATVVVADGSGRTSSMPITVWTDPGLGEASEPLVIAADRPILATLEGAALTQPAAASRFVVPDAADELTATCAATGVTLVVAEPGAEDRTIACDPAAPTTIPPVAEPDDLEESLAAGTVVTSLDGRTFELTATVDGVASTVHGFLTARPIGWPEPTSTRTVEGLFPATATWTSAPIATDGGVVGALDVAVSLPVTADAATSVAVTVTDGVSSMTVDATATPTEVSEALAVDGVVELERRVALPASMDGSAALTVSITLSSEDRSLAPTVRSLAVSHDLPAVSVAPDEPLTSAIVDGPVLRIAAGATMTPGSTLSVDTVDGTPGIALSTSSLEPGAVVLLEADGTGGTFDLVVRHGASGVLTLRRVTLTP